MPMYYTSFGLSHLPNYVVTMIRRLAKILRLFYKRAPIYVALLHK